MSDMSTNHSDRKPNRGALEPQGRQRTPDRSFADSLKKIVRRILRTQSCRTNFEARVLEEARRMLNSCEMARDTLERLLVDQLMGERREGQMELAGQGAGALCPPTQLAMSNSTFARRVTGE